MDFGYNFPKTLMENISEQNDKINACIDFINNFKTDDDTKNNYKANPVYYGADPNGQLPSGKAINKCIQENQGKAIKLSPGLYYIEEPIITPYYTDKQVNIDFNGSIFYTDKSLQYVLGIGFYNYGDDMPNKDDYSKKTCYAIFQNLVIYAPNSEVGILTKNKYWYPRLKNISIFNTKIGVKVGESDPGNWSSDLYAENIFIQCKDYKDTTTVGMILYGNDNKISNCRVYNGYKGMVINSGGNVFDNIHVYLYGHFNDRNTTGFSSVYPNLVAIQDNGDNNSYNSVCTDSYSTHYKITTENYKGVFSKCFLYTNVVGFDDIAFDFSSSKNIQYLSINKCNINLKQSGKNGNIGIKRSSTQRSDDMCLNWDITNNITKYITQDLLLADRQKQYVFPFSGAYKFKPNKYYIVGYIPIVSYIPSYTVNITGTGSNNQRGRIYINGDGFITEFNNQGVSGDLFGIGAKKVNLRDGFEYIEVSIMTSYEKSAILGLSFDYAIDGYNYGIIPVYERHIHGDPSSLETTPSITQTFGE